MSGDSLAEFRWKNDAQFQRARAGLWLIAREFVHYLSVKLVEVTPGFGNQYELTRYIPTGRLRGGWNWTDAPIGSTSKGYDAARGEAGPFSDYGLETVQRILGQMPQRLPAISYLENDVAYGYDIVRGEGNHGHIGPRDFPKEASLHQTTAYQQALAAFRRASL